MVAHRNGGVWVAAIAGLVAFAVWTPASTLRAQSPEDAAPPAAYGEWIDRALDEFGAGRYREAAAAFARAHGLFPNARSLRGMAMATFEFSDYPEALRLSEAALAHPVHPLDADLRAQLTSLRERCEAFVGVFELEGVTDDMTVRVDSAPRELGDEARLVLGLGRHRVEVSAAGHETEILELDVRGGERRTLTLDLSPSTAPAPTPESTRTSAPRSDAASDTAAGPPPPFDPPSPFDPIELTPLITGLVAVVGALLSIAWIEDRQSQLDRCHADPIRCSNVLQISRERDAAIGVSLGLGAAGLGLSTAGAVWLAVP